jgi:hypothetical protein
MNNELTVNPDFGSDVSSTFVPPTYDIDPADAHIVDEIRALDMLTEVPGASTVTGSINIPEPKLSTLPPAIRETIERQLAMVPASQREATEKELITKALRQNAANTRALGGLSSEATPYHAEMATVAREVRTAEAEFDKISDQLATVLRYDNRWDDEKQESVPVPVYAFEGSLRTALINRQAELNYRIKLLANEDGTLGIEGRRRVDRAMLESVALRKARDEQVADLKAVDARAQELAREARIERQAKIRAKMLDKDFHSQ